MNILPYNPLKGSSYIQLLSEFRNSATKGLINLKNNDNLRHLNPQEKHRQGSKKTDIQTILDYSGIEFSVSVKQYNRIGKNLGMKKNNHSQSNILYQKNSSQMR